MTLKMISTKSVHDCYEDDSVDAHHEEVTQIYERYAKGHREAEMLCATWTVNPLHDYNYEMDRIDFMWIESTDTALNGAVEYMSIKDGVDAFEEVETGRLVLRAYYYPQMEDVYFLFK